MVSLPVLGKYAMSILKSLDGDPACCCRYFFEYENPPAGAGRFISTYQGDGNPPNRDTLLSSLRLSHSARASSSGDPASRDTGMGSPAKEGRGFPSPW